VLTVSLSACDTGPAAADKQPIATVRVKLDVERNRVWLLTREGLAIYDPAAPNRILRVPVHGWRIGRDPHGCLPDLALDPRGGAVISSDIMPVLWRVDPETLAVTRHELRVDDDRDKEVGFTYLRYLPAQQAYLAASGPRGTIWRIDRELRYAHRLLREAPRMQNCSARADALVRAFGALN